MGYWETSQHIPCIVRDPRNASSAGTVVQRFTENVDIMPTICDAVGIDIPVQCDGLPLTPFLEGTEPPWWRDAAHWEYDWRFALIQLGADVPWPWKRSLEKQTTRQWKLFRQNLEDHPAAMMESGIASATIFTRIVRDLLFGSNSCD